MEGNSKTAEIFGEVAECSGNYISSAITILSLERSR